MKFSPKEYFAVADIHLSLCKSINRGSLDSKCGIITIQSEGERITRIDSSYLITFVDDRDITFKPLDTL